MTVGSYSKSAPSTTVGTCCCSLSAPRVPGQPSSQHSCRHSAVACRAWCFKPSLLLLLLLPPWPLVPQVVSPQLPVLLASGTPLSCKLNRQLATVWESPSVHSTWAAPARCSVTPTMPAPQPISRQARPAAKGERLDCWQPCSCTGWRWCPSAWHADTASNCIVCCAVSFRPTCYQSCIVQHPLRQKEAGLPAGKGGARGAKRLGRNGGRGRCGATL